MWYANAGPSIMTFVSVAVLEFELELELALELEPVEDDAFCFELGTLDIVTGDA